MHTNHFVRLRIIPEIEEIFWMATQVLDGYIIKFRLEPNNQSNRIVVHYAFAIQIP